METHSKYADLSNKANDFLSTIPYGVRVDASVSHVQDVLSGSQSRITCKTLSETDILKTFAQSNDLTLGSNNPALGTRNIENDLEIKRGGGKNSSPNGHCP